MPNDEPPQRSDMRFWSPGTLLLAALMVIGAAFLAARFLFGLGFVTNLDDAHPWGIWIAIDVASGVALAAGGFTTAALVYVIGKKTYQPVIRPALLTAWLGYALVGTAVFVDIGRSYNVWHPLVMWQGNSVLFEVGICVMAYLTVLTIEFAPTIIEGISLHVARDGLAADMLKRLDGPLIRLRTVLNRVMPVFIIAGVVLSCMHQSSLGSLMLIAPHKLHPLWYTPLLPLLFLSSAIAVGLPMVIFESVCAARVFRRRVEMDILPGLARYAFVLLAIYAVLKFGDLLVRGAGGYLLGGGRDARAFIVEVVLGVLLPLVLLATPRVRRSVGGLFVSSCLIIGGVLLNRINVFLVGYHPPFTDHAYFPSIGELAVTVAFIAGIVFCYRLFASFCPVLPASEPARRERGARPDRAAGPIAVGVAMAVALAVGPTLIARADQAEPPQEGVVRLVIDPESQVAEVEPFPVEPCLLISRADALKVLNDPAMNARDDDYEAVRLMHRKHANISKGDCTACHHRMKQSAGDRIGVPVTYQDLDGRRPSACSGCHDRAAEPDHVLRPGLKGAYHQLCMDCHQTGREKPSGLGPNHSPGPTGCTGCHHQRVPDHHSLVELSSEVAPQEVTRECLRCHQEQGREMLETVHWKWTGRSGDTLGHEKRNDLGKRDIVNNYCIHVTSNWARCTMCHVGYGWKDMSFDFEDPRNIDCLVCHDTTGTYRKYPTAAGVPVLKQDYPQGREWPPGSGTMMPPVDLVSVAKSVGRPSRSTCGACHFYGGGGDAVKHGDMCSTLDDPPPEHDVHMGRYDFRCQECHTTREHRIDGACQAIPAREGRVTCAQCHTGQPHVGASLLNLHLNDHCETVACQTCHIPVFAKGRPTKMQWDWSTAGEKEREVHLDEYGMPDYNVKKGSFVWAKFVQPTYRWYNGKNRRYVSGDEIDIEQMVWLNRPVGFIHQPDARIYPYKIHKARQLCDVVNQELVVPHLFGGYWKDWDWDKAAEAGMRAAGRPFSGESGWADTGMHWGINHGVVPAEQALSCTQCHTAPDAVNCMRCHRSRGGEMTRSLVDLYQGMLDDEREPANIHFEELGYEGDPAVVGGRCSRIPPPRPNG